MEQNHDMDEIDLLELARLLWSHALQIAAAGIAAAVICLLVCTFVLTPRYQASVNLIVNSRQDGNASITSDNINSARNLIDTYAVIIKSNIVLNDVIEQLGLDMTYRQLLACVSVDGVGSTQIMSITVTNEDPALAGKIVQAIAETAPDVIVDKVEAGSCKVVSDVEITSNPVFPQTKKYVLTAALGGIVAACSMTTSSIARTSRKSWSFLYSALSRRCNTMWNPFNRNTISNSSASKRSLQLITQKGMPFAYVEAYKALRTNLNFLSGSGDVHAFVVTSTVPEEAKSNVSVNLALALTESGKKVVLVDCDLRKPVLHRYLKAGHNLKGVSNVLSRQVALSDALVELKDIPNLTFLPAGTTPPNPSELLSQPQMQEMVNTLRGSYDFVILDAPPISMVTDAAVIGRIVDGALFVVRSKYASTDAVKTALEKLQDAGVKVLGAVLTRYDAKKSLKRSDYGYGYYYYNSNYSYGPPPDGISESAAKKSGLTSKKQHNGKEKHSVHTEDEA